MNSIQKLTEIFGHFPGIGPRQAKRFVYYLLTRNSNVIDELVRHISELKRDVAICSECGRYFEARHSKVVLCDVCADGERDRTTLMIVPRDVDLESVEKNGVYTGTYFVLGGTVPILDKEPEKRVRRDKMLELLKKREKELVEIILGVSANPEGENTANYVREILKPVISPEVKISMLGRGLSTGTELEYTDPDTLRSALKNRG